MGLSVGSLFSGIGGFDLGLERAGMSVKWQVEIDAYCNRVLAKHWPSVQRYGDIKAIDWAGVEPVDLVCGGFPCQPFSVAGKRRGQGDDRYLWPEVVRCLTAIRPTWFFGENVPGIINMALDQVCADLEGLGYTVWPVCIPACAVDAPHKRQRVWLVANANQRSCQRSWPALAGADTCKDERGGALTNAGGPSESPGVMADTYRERLPQPACSRIGNISGENKASQGRELSGDAPTPWRTWPTEPNVGRVAHGVPNRVDRLRGLGNAIVPQIAEELGKRIMYINDEEAR